MGLFDKEKLSAIANKAKDTVKESISDAITEQQRRKELNLLGSTVISKLEYKGGHPDLTKEKDCTIKADDDYLVISYGFSSAQINYSDISGVHFETVEQINRRITATRLVLLGPFALAFKKKQKDNEKYLTIDFNHKGIENTCVIGGKNVADAHSKIFERYAGFVQRNPKIEANTSNDQSAKLNNDPYEELKKAKELLDMGIISQEEFEAKKKELLNL